ncbi:hypothetical protein ACIRPT_02725 [Streptomyces sp. NPDC101227]|uniref:hypothetical protein n=1 Tax=Streptomyces sp. NPDC101227 TaxID=3366136 RepID=UPI0038254BF1
MNDDHAIAAEALEATLKHSELVSTMLASHDTAVDLLTSIVMEQSKAIGDLRARIRHLEQWHQSTGGGHG